MPEEVYVCEICGGTFIGKPVIIDLDGYKAVVCPSCARKIRGRSIKREELKVDLRKAKQAPLKGNIQRKKPKGIPLPKRKPKIEEVDYIEGYGSKIREAREELGLTVEQIATALNIKSSLLRNIEAEKVVPPYDIARGIEKLLEIDIIQRNPERSSHAITETGPPVISKPITLGEAIEVKKKRRKK